MIIFIDNYSSWINFRKYQFQSITETLDFVVYVVESGRAYALSKDNLFLPSKRKKKLTRFAQLIFLVRYVWFVMPPGRHIVSYGAWVSFAVFGLVLPVGCACRLCAVGNKAAVFEGLGRLFRPILGTSLCSVSVLRSFLVDSIFKISFDGMVFVLNRQDADFFLKRGFTVEIIQGVGTQIEPPIEGRKLPSRFTRLRVGFVGRALQSKGVFTFLSIVQIIRGSEFREYFEFELITEPSYGPDSISIEYLANKCASLNVKLMCFGEHYRKTISSWDVNLLPSQGEGSPVVLRDVGILGVVSITSSASGCIDQFCWNDAGFSGITSVEGYVSILIFLHENRDILLDMSHQALSRFSQERADRLGREHAQTLIGSLHD